MQTVQTSSNAGSLDASFLESPIPLERQEKIASHLWGNGNTYKKQHLWPYFQYYTEQCRLAFLSYGDLLVVRTHEHILKIAERLQGGCSRAETKRFLDESTWIKDPTSEKAIDASIDLTVRLLCMLDVGELENAYSGREKLLWTTGSQQEFLRDTLLESADSESDGTKLDRSFKMCNMVRIAGFRVEPTSNIYDHLRFRDRKKTVEIFHHASFLMSHKQQSIFPLGLVGETLATLALLFPQGDKETEKWYKRQDGPEELDENILQCGKMDRPIGDYRYWHHRIVILKSVFDNSRPSNLKQWWNDRRDVSQWYPLWVAISLTVLFGLVQSIEGALQEYKAYNP